MEFGLFDVYGRQEEASIAEDFDRKVEDVRYAESKGYRYYFCIEHQSSAQPVITAPNVYLAALATHTSTIRLGAMIYQVPFHHPVRLAQDVALVDQLSRGRVEFGLGYGVAVKEFEAWGMDYAQRREMGNEAVEIMLKAWQSDVFSHDGTHWNFRDMRPQPKPYQQPYPRIWMGAHSPESFDYAAKMNFNLAQNIDVEAVIIEKFNYFRKAWEAYGHAGPRPRTLLVRHVHVAETDELAIAQADPYMRQGMAGQRGVNLAKSVSADASPERKETARLYLESTKGCEFWVGEGLAFVGSPTTVARRIREQQALAGYDILLVAHQITTMPRELVRRSTELFADEVMPAFEPHAVLA
jgi:alkanesulfonate monooxygenase SsuD/methylene tetrahydromethanopterin reductase-like flavin-dependent oxidoreductase (luciferase family)